jgi:hypothetical protein
MRLTHHACLAVVLLAAAAVAAESAAHAAEAPPPHVFATDYSVGTILDRLGQWYDAHGYGAYGDGCPLPEVMELEDILQRMVARESGRGVAAWIDEGGPAEVRFEGRTLVVTQTAAGHERVSQLVDMLARALPQPRGRMAKPVPLARTQPVVAVPDSPSDAAALKALERPMDVDVEMTSLDNVLKHVDEMRGDIEIRVEPEAAGAGIALSARVVTLKVKGVPAECILELALTPDLTFTVRDGRVAVVPREFLNYNLVPRMYPVEDVLRAWEGAEPPLDEPQPTGQWQELVDIIQRCVNNCGDHRVAAWSDEGGPAAIGYLAGILIITQTRQAHDRIAGILDALRAPRAAAPGSGIRPVAVAQGHDGLRQAVRRSLETRIEVDFDNATLAAAIEALRRAVPELNMVVAESVAATGINSDTYRVTLRLKDVPVRVALEATLPEELGWRVEPGYVLVTTAEDASDRMPAEVYDIGGILQALLQWRVREYDWQEVVDLIQRSVSKQGDPAVAAWSDEGGPAAVEYLLPDLLIVTQTPRGLKRTLALLAALEQALTAATDGAGNPMRETVPVPDPAADAGRRRLEKPVSVALANTPLDEALAMLAAVRPDLNLRVDAKALEDAGLGAAARRVMVEGGPRPLADLLDRILPPEMGYAADEAGVVVGTNELTYRRMEMLIYAVADFYQVPDDRWRTLHAEFPNLKYESMEVVRLPSWDERIRKMVRPEDGAATWDDEGGPAQVNVLGPLLIVTQSPRGQEGVQRALERLREEAKGK